MVETFFATLQGFTILLGIGLLGFVLISRRIIAEEVLQSLSRLAIEVALPCLAFTQILESFSPEAFARWWRLPLLYIAFVLGTAFVTALATPMIAPPGQRREAGAALLYQNALFVPLIIITEIHGASSNLLVVLFLFTLLFAPFFFTTSPLFYTGLSARNMPWHKIINPVLIATVLAVALRLTGADVFVPGFVTGITDMVGSMSAPLLLIILGGTIYLDIKKDGQIEWATICRFTAVKMILFPALMLGIVLVLQPPREVAYLLVLQSAVPPITSLPILTGRFGGNRRLVNHLLIASFAAGLVTIPLTMAVFSALIVS